MSRLGHLSTNKTWTQSLRDLKTELTKWGVVDYILPTFEESNRAGAVTVSYAINGKWLPLTSGHFPSQAVNLRALVMAIEGSRKADQRGIGGLMAAALQHKALTGADPRSILGIPPGTTDAGVMRHYYLERIKATHPDHGGDEKEFIKVMEAGKALGLDNGGG